MNKNLFTNLAAMTLIIVGVLLPDPWQRPVLFTGLFALAGALTNSIAIHMLFEKIPGLYGSGVIVMQFSAFKRAIEQLIMEQFFSKQHLEQFFEQRMVASQRNLNFSAVIDQLDLTLAWQSLMQTIKESSFGGMLSMFGGDKALKSLQSPFEQKCRQALTEMAEGEAFQKQLRDQLGHVTISDEMHDQVREVVQGRLTELTPEMVKHIIQQMIRQHLGWLVLWGGVFGGLIGLASSFLPI